MDGSEELFRQLGLRQFGNLPRLKLDPPPSLRALISFAVEAETDTEASGMSKEELIDVRIQPASMRWYHLIACRHSSIWSSPDATC